ncbi:hypothetical protein NDU88_003150 [Pleurodeles waltl]|uniref:Uncharacterized protein n=1 Tax=Pleurodeles waltl TaxID=8319 RepID=A0AAV7LHS4_PLEWA|nr:hypothetical protein NDU88_003150 [Pleurodeles waltl]
MRRRPAAPSVRRTRSGEVSQVAAVVWRDPRWGIRSPEGRVVGGASPVGSMPERGEGGARWLDPETWPLRKDDSGVGTPRVTVLFSGGDAGGPGHRMEEWTVCSVLAWRRCELHLRVARGLLCGEEADGCWRGPHLGGTESGVVALVLRGLAEFLSSGC